MGNAKTFAIIALVLGALSGVLGLLIALFGYAAAGARGVGKHRAGAEQV